MVGYYGQNIRSTVFMDIVYRVGVFIYKVKIRFIALGKFFINKVIKIRAESFFKVSGEIFAEKYALIYNYCTQFIRLLSHILSFLLYLLGVSVS